MMNETVLQQIYNHLKTNGIDVYAPSQHKGDCTSPYVVIRGGGVVQLLTVSSERPVYTLMFYVPYKNFFELDAFKDKVKEIMKDLYPMVMYGGNESEDYYEESNKSYMKSVEYYGIRRIKYTNYERSVDNGGN